MQNAQVISTFLDPPFLLSPKNQVDYLENIYINFQGYQVNDKNFYYFILFYKTLSTVKLLRVERFQGGEGIVEDDSGKVA